MGLADLFERFNLAYDSAEAYELSDKIMEFISYEAIDESADLARERGSYHNFLGSMWSKGNVPADTIAVLREARGALDQNEDLKLDWDKLREKVKGGMRNSTLLAIAPTANWASGRNFDRN